MGRVIQASHGSDNEPGPLLVADDELACRVGCNVKERDAIAWRTKPIHAPVRVAGPRHNPCSSYAEARLRLDRHVLDVEYTRRDVSDP